MTKRYRVVIGISVSLATAGCASNNYIPLVFLQTQTLGITANASGSQATPELTLGYRDLDAALVPVSIGESPLLATITDAKGGHFTDSLSVFGQFNAEVGAAATTTAALGKFFATGQAAKRLADGFSHKLDGSKQGSN